VNEAAVFQEVATIENFENVGALSVAPSMSSRGIQTADASLTKEQGLLLLSKLAEDDAFRCFYEQKPAEALLRLGIPAQLVCCLPATCLVPRKLGEREAMEDARKQLAADVNTSPLQFIIPQPGFSQSKSRS
jgi:putative modified peptide